MKELISEIIKITLRFFVFGLGVVFGNYLSSKGLPENYKCNCKKENK